MTYGQQIKDLRRLHYISARRCAKWWGCAEGTWRSYEAGPDSHFNAALLNYLTLSIARGALKGDPNDGVVGYNWKDRLKKEGGSGMVAG